MNWSLGRNHHHCSAYCRHSYFIENPELFIKDLQIFIGDHQNLIWDTKFFIGDPQIFIGNPRFLLKTPFSLIQFGGLWWKSRGVCDNLRVANKKKLEVSDTYLGSSTKSVGFGEKLASPMKTWGLIKFRRSPMRWSWCVRWKGVSDRTTMMIISPWLKI